MPEDLRGLHAMPLFDAPFWFAFPDGDPPGECSSLTEVDLAGRRLLLLAEGHCLHDQALAVCGQNARNNSTSPDVLRVSSLETICVMVASGLGRTLLPALAVARLTSGGTGVAARPFKAAGAVRRIGLLWRTASPRRDDFVALGKFIQDLLSPDVLLREAVN